MKVIYLDCGMGAAGDMLMGALYELLSQPEREIFLQKINHAGIPGVTVLCEESVKCGIVGTHMKVTVDGIGEQSQDVLEHAHEAADRHHGQVHGGAEAPHAHGTAETVPDHAYHTHHHHTSMKEIRHLVEACNVSGQVKQDTIQIYESIARAESKVHGRPVEEVHFHEVGMYDALADIMGCALLMEMLKPDMVMASAVNTGFGKVRCAHGILPVPAPATVNLLQGIPCYAGQFEGELCTPTGAALLQYYVDAFGRMPVMCVATSGYGMGKKDFEAVNAVRALSGERAGEEEDVLELCCNLDDMSPENLAFACDILRENGALDVFTSGIGMKKGRTGVLLHVLCRKKDKEQIASLIFRHTTTIGIREYVCRRMVLERTQQLRDTPYGAVHVKKSSGYGVKKEKIEFEDLQRIARETGKGIEEIRREIE